MTKKSRHILMSFAALLVVTLLATFTVAGVTAQAPQERDFFGTVLSAGDGLLVLSTEEGTVEIPIVEDTKIRLPRKHDAALADLAEGDLVAVSLEEADGSLVADKVFLIPGKTQHRHVPGVVTGIEVRTATDTRITIQPPSEVADPITFTRGPSTKVRFRKGATEIAVGNFVVILAARDPVTGELLSDALEIHVVKLQIEPEPQGDGVEVKAEAANTAKIRGTFEGVDADGNWIIDGKPVTVDPDTEIKSAVAAGQLVKVEAVLLPDGTLLASEIEVVDEHGRVSNKTRLEGIFEGVDDEGNWVISGTKVAVGPGTDTDGLPAVGQRVKVKALLQEDGSLLAREIENKGGRGPREDDASEVKLEGIFQGTDEEGNWIVNGTKVSVDPLTRLEGTPAVGQRVEVKAVLQKDGSLLARKIEGEEKRAGKSKSEAKIRGVIEAVGDNSITINGITLALSVLTELDGELEVGRFAEVEALLQEDGTLVAKEVEIKGKPGDEETPERSKVEIEGTIESVSEDGTTLVVNGITVTISPLSEIQGSLTVDASVKVEGVLLDDGSLLARKVKGEGRRATRSGTEVKIEGVIEALQTDSQGRITGMTIDGLEVAIEALTKVEGELQQGVRVEVKGIFSDGVFLASKVEVEEQEDAEPAEASEAKIEGVIEAIETDAQGRIISVTINGVQVEIDPDAEVEGSLEVGSTVEIKGALSDGVFRATKVKSEEDEERPEAEERKRSEFQLEGRVESVQRDENDNIVSIVIDGQTVLVQAITQVRGTVEVGVTVEVRGIVSGDDHIASRIKSEEDDKGDRDSGSGSESGSSEFRLEGKVEAVNLDSDGNMVSVVVDGKTVVVDAATEVKGTVEVGSTVEIRGTISGDTRVASRIEVEE